MALLSSQFVAPGDTAAKIRLSLLSLATVDALGGPVEFKRRSSFPLLDKMIPNKNFGVPKGTWTDDTSMTLCLARSIATFTTNEGSVGAFDEANQLDAYLAWFENGSLSCTGECFDIGSTIRSALNIWSLTKRTTKVGVVHVALNEIDRQLYKPNCRGNGSLMRVLPIGLAYWRNEQEALHYARRSSRTTHPDSMCVEACEIYTRIISKIMGHSTNGHKYSKLQLLWDISQFPINNAELKEALHLPFDQSASEKESFLRAHHPLFHLIDQYSPDSSGTIQLPPPKVIPSSGYVLHTLVAALYCFFATTTFEAGAIMSINLGDDADTVGAVYGGLAGCWYGSSSNGDYWSEKVKEWQKDLACKDVIEDVANELVKFEARFA